MAIPDPATTNWVPIWNPIGVGPAGPAGPTGPQGPKGDKGDKGDIGPAGDLGTTGLWINNPFNAADFTAAAGAWTVTLIQASRYTLIGKTIIWCLNVQTSSISVATDSLFAKLPSGFTAGTIINMGANMSGYITSSTGNMPGILISTIGDTRVRLFNTLGTFPAGAISVFITFIGEIL